MPTVDLVCTYDSSTSDAWTNGSNISVDDGSRASRYKSQFQLVPLGFTTDAATAIPAGAIKTSIQLVVKLQVSGAYGQVYLKDPGSFADGGSAAHSITFSSALTTYVTGNLITEKPALATDPLTSGYIRMYHTSEYMETFYVDYVSLRVTYTEAASGYPHQFMFESF